MCDRESALARVWVQIGPMAILVSRRQGHSCHCDKTHIFQSDKTLHLVMLANCYFLCRDTCGHSARDNCIWCGGYLFTAHSLMILKYFEVEYFPFYRKSPTEIHKKSFNPSRGLGHNYLQFVKTNNCLQWSCDEFVKSGEQGRNLGAHYFLPSHWSRLCLEGADWLRLGLMSRTQGLVGRKSVMGE